MPRKRRQTTSRPNTAFLDCLNIGGGIALLIFMSPDDAPAFALVCREARAAVARHPWAVTVGGAQVAAATAARPAAVALTVTESAPRRLSLGASPSANPIALTAALAKLNLTSSLASLTLECCVAPAALAAALAGPLRRLQVLRLKDATQPPSYLSFPGARFRRCALVLDLRLLSNLRPRELSCNIGETDPSESESGTGADLAALAHTTLKVLDVRALRPLTFGGAQAAALPHLAELSLEGEFVFTAAPAALSALTQLRALRLVGVRMAPAQAPAAALAIALAQAPAQVQVQVQAQAQTLDFEPFGAAHLRALALTRFEARNCPGARATDDWFAALADTPSVKLNITLEVTAAAFAHLGGSARLYLAGLTITDAILADLKAAAHLTLIGCDTQAVTAAGLRAPPLAHLRTDDPDLYRIAVRALPKIQVSLISGYESD